MKNRDNLVLALAILFALGATAFLLRLHFKSSPSKTSSASIENASVYNFDDIVLESDLPVLVDFWAEWCGPCRMLAPNISAVALQGAGKLKVVKVNVDEAKPLAARFNVELLPTLVIFKNGKEQERLNGYLSKDSLVTVLKKYVSL